MKAGKPKTPRRWLTVGQYRDLLARLPANALVVHYCGDEAYHPILVDGNGYNCPSSVHTVRQSDDLAGELPVGTPVVYL